MRICKSQAISDILNSYCAGGQDINYKSIMKHSVATRILPILNISVAEVNAFFYNIYKTAKPRRLNLDLRTIYTKAVLCSAVA